MAISGALCGAVGAQSSHLNCIVFQCCGIGTTALTACPAVSRTGCSLLAASRHSRFCRSFVRSTSVQQVVGAPSEINSIIIAPSSSFMALGGVIPMLKEYCTVAVLNRQSFQAEGTIGADTTTNDLLRKEAKERWIVTALIKILVLLVMYAYVLYSAGIRCVRRSSFLSVQA